MQTSKQPDRADISHMTIGPSAPDQPKPTNHPSTNRNTSLPRTRIAKYWMRWFGSRLRGHTRARWITQLSCGCGSVNGNPCNGKTITITHAEQTTKNMSFFSTHIITGDRSDSCWRYSIAAAALAGAVSLEEDSCFARFRNTAESVNTPTPINRSINRPIKSTDIAQRRKRCVARSSELICHNHSQR